MYYAKVKDDQLLKFPYNWGDLSAENPYTSYDSRFDLAGWYEQTEEGVSTGNKVVKVYLQESPEIDNMHKIKYDDQPVLEDGNWVLKYTVVEKSEDEIVIQAAVSQAANN